MPCSIFSIKGFRGVPYQWEYTCAYSKNSCFSTMSWKTFSSIKKYSRPCSSPGRGFLVVNDTECHSPETDATICLHKVVFPAPEGAEMIYKTPRRSGPCRCPVTFDGASSLVGV